MLRPTDYRSSSFAHLRSLPTGDRPITSWPDDDRALYDVIKELRRVIKNFQPSSTMKTVPLLSIPHRRNDFFIGRQAILACLSHALETNQGIQLNQPLALTGLAGIGKTQVALEYIYRYQEQYEAIFWIRADSQEILQNDLMALTQVLEMRQVYEQPLKIIATIQQWLNEHTHWLLVLDNVENMADIQPFLFCQKTGSILITTRIKAVGSIARPLEVSCMLPNEGLTFLLSRSQKIPPGDLSVGISSAERQEAEAIVREMGGLPLALDQAGAFIEETQCSFTEYYQLFLQRQTELLHRRGQYMGTHPEPIATTWSLSFSRIQQSNPEALAIISLCAFLDADNIPEEIFTGTIVGFDAPLAPVMVDRLLFHETIRELLSYSLVQRNLNGTLSIHRLMQAVLKQRMDPQEQVS